MQEIIIDFEKIELNNWNQKITIVIKGNRNNQNIVFIYQQHQNHSPYNLNLTLLNIHKPLTVYLFGKYRKTQIQLGKADLLLKYNIHQVSAVYNQSLIGFIHYYISRKKIKKGSRSSYGLKSQKCRYINKQYHGSEQLFSSYFSKPISPSNSSPRRLNQKQQQILENQLLGLIGKQMILDNKIKQLQDKFKDNQQELQNLKKMLNDQ